MSTVRPAAVAGSFYPGDPRTLSAQLGELLAAPAEPAESGSTLKAVIVPHAGYVYSGAVAARAYDALAGARSMTRSIPTAAIRMSISSCSAVRIIRSSRSGKS